MKLHNTPWGTRPSQISPPRLCDSCAVPMSDAEAEESDSCFECRGAREDTFVPAKEEKGIEIVKVSELLSEDNWGQGLANERGECRVCLGMMIDRAYPTPKDNIRVRNAVKQTLQGREIFQWNDDPARTFAEVKALCEKLDI